MVSDFFSRFYFKLFDARPIALGLQSFESILLLLLGRSFKSVNLVISSGIIIIIHIIIFIFVFLTLFTLVLSASLYVFRLTIITSEHHSIDCSSAVVRLSLTGNIFINFSVFVNVVKLTVLNSLV